jgi:hypothetical protein
LTKQLRFTKFDKALMVARAGFEGSRSCKPTVTKGVAEEMVEDGVKEGVGEGVVLNAVYSATVWL